MAQVSKKFLSKDISQRMFEVFFSAFTKLSGENVADFIEDLLTPTEKIMLAKRFTIAFLLLKGYEYEEIADILKVSKGTIWNVKAWLRLKGQGYRTIIEKISKEEKIKKILKEIKNSAEEFWRFRYGANWKKAGKELWKKRMAERKPF